jgi:hypothetical protein
MQDASKASWQGLFLGFLTQLGTAATGVVQGSCCLYRAYTTQGMHLQQMLLFNSIFCHSINCHTHSMFVAEALYMHA